jgi:putative transposase
MPWKESDPMSERLKFVSRFLDGERMADLCREFEISRKTGYKLVQRYEENGIEGIKDRSPAPFLHPNQTPPRIEQAVIDLRQQHPTWGAPKIKTYLERKSMELPAISTIHAILRRYDMVKIKRRRPSFAKAKGTILTTPSEPNALWCTDFKGQFRLGNGKYCYPLTVTDQNSRFLLACEGYDSVEEMGCIDAFHRLFGQYGLPKAIKSDNGVPFSSRSLFGMSKLSVFWIRLGIGIERIKPGNPQENGSHERMHRTLKAETTKPPSSNSLCQQERFDAFQTTFNYERPHAAIGMKSPGELYHPSKVAYDPEIVPLRYPEHSLTTRITKCGRIFIANKKLNLSVAIGKPFGGYNVGLKLVDKGLWQADFMHHTLGFFDMETQKLQVAINPFMVPRR